MHPLLETLLRAVE
jgi:hypothetical protein